MSNTDTTQRLVETLMRFGPLHRADLARYLAVSRTTITKTVEPLLNSGLLTEIQKADTTLKRPLTLTPQLGLLAAITYVADTCTLALATLDGNLLFCETVNIDDSLTGENRLVHGQALLYRAMQKTRLNSGQIRGVHIAVDTQINVRTGEIPAAQASSHWYGVNPKTWWRENLHALVRVENSLRLEALAEALYGSGKNYLPETSRNLIYLDIHRGITAGHIFNLTIDAGSLGGAGEVGHMIFDAQGPLCTCGNNGCVMQYMSVTSMLRDYATATEKNITWEEFAQLYINKDPVARALTTRSVQVCAALLINLAHFIDPEAIFISHRAVGALPGFITQVAQLVKSKTLPLISQHLLVAPATISDHARPYTTARAALHILRRDRQIIDGFPLLKQHPNQKQR